MEDIYTDLKALKKLGVVVYSANTSRSVQNILDNILAPILEHTAFDSLNASVNEIVPTPPRETTVYLSSEKWFEKFCQFASRSTYRDKEYRENCLLFNLLYTNHDGFTWDDIPVFKNNKLVSECKYEADKIYSVRILSEERRNEQKSYMEDIIMYLPSTYINCLQ